MKKIKINQEKYINLIYDYYVSVKQDEEEFDFYKYSASAGEKCGLDTILKFTFNIDNSKCYYTLSIIDKSLWKDVGSNFFKNV
jgi:hypothetical protein